MIHAPWKWTIARKGAVIIALPLAAQLLLLSVLFEVVREQEADRDAELRAKEVVAAAYRTLGLLVDAETGMRGYALSGNPVFTEPYDRATAALPAELEHLRRIAPEESRRSVDELERMAAACTSYHTHNRTLIQSGRRDEAIDNTSRQIGKRLMDRFRRRMDQFLAEQRQWEADRRAASRRSARHLIAAVIGGCIAEIGLAIALALFFTRSISRRLQIVVENTARLERGEPLIFQEEGGDEIAQLDQRFHEMATALDTSKAELQAANRDLESFSYSVSHDLRAPLRAISGYSAILQEEHADRLDEEGVRFLSTIRHEAQRMGTLIDELLSFSRLNKKPVNKCEFDISVLARDTFRRLDGDRSLQLLIGDLPTAYGDPLLIGQVIENLLSNAIKFSLGRDGSTIEVGGETSDREAVFWVRDRGVGFDPRYASKLFGVFQRLHPNEEFEGTGVGLAIVARIIQRHGGRVWAEGALDEGACFYFTLPVPEGQSE